VIGVLVVALLLGGGAMVLAQGQSETATNAEAGLTVRYPQGWLLKTGQDESLAFQAVDPASGVFKTTLEVRVVPISPDAAAIDATGSTTSILALVLGNLSLSRAQQTTAYRQLEMKEGANIGRQPSMEAAYVYVHAEADRQGAFVLPLPLERGECYTMIIAADGYWLYAEDGVCIGTDVPDVLEMDVQLEKK